ncbi:aromatic aminobenezylarsenical efflux permease ArsG family transporter [Shewanella waksmanii]|uniref:aromatic aminobenezylarsenical efflux permease ArsG family transporter n=1 Tax=Shewanella waksmanii TaxID=213783 RepID=UPI00048CDC63|nr:aromatic aminobenezylarsenical efflux permease ArsG family transporter [Shewanella waksmanii]
MVEWFIILGSALWFGVLTSISPCPLATNIAAVSFLSKQVNHTTQSLWMGAAYSSGRMSSYMVLAALLLYGVASTPKLSHFLQTQMNILLGPVLLLVGACLLGLIRLPSSSWGLSNQLQQHLAKQGQWGAFALGSIFALSFCPTSAALFFASLLPLIMAQQSSFWVPAIYGVGTAMPVLIISALLTLGTIQVANIYNQLTLVERCARRASGAIFLLAGFYYCWLYLMPFLR